ncbi:hypothetical protein BO82DRAFT_402149 [Aspergillus uvarum CBS 121591]|uniref:Uncharacterized protein n=1 Tax=Aspergillus uvarum CBS 121591 TaxID=1448315 RepID=A0A319CS96_9EURO|nr:hypothetical protein BO82DRAFT_402149 [Aspergillus uvarum CBS 121591]PYH81623.1 hypothetical protein BO82DRAFT_402149 [Aspergillus uvarum CBS 121591]
MADANVATSQLPDHTPLMVHTVRGVIGASTFADLLYVPLDWMTTWFFLPWYAFCFSDGIPLLGFQENSTDYTYVGAVPLILMNLEYALGLISGSLPSLRVLVRFIPGLNSSKRSTYPTQEWELSEPVEYRFGGRPRWMHRPRGGDAKSIESESRRQILEVQESPRPLESAGFG